MTKNIGFIGYGLRSRTMMKAFAAIEADMKEYEARIPDMV